MSSITSAAADTASVASSISINSTTKIAEEDTLLVPAALIEDGNSDGGPSPSVILLSLVQGPLMLASTTQKATLSKRMISSTLRYLPLLRLLKKRNNNNICSEEEIARFIIILNELLNFYKQSNLCLSPISPMIKLPLTMEIPLRPLEQLKTKEIIPTFLNLLASVTLFDSGCLFTGEATNTNTNTLINLESQPLPLLDGLYAKQLHFTFCSAEKASSASASTSPVNLLLNSLTPHLQSLSLLSMHQTYTTILLSMLRQHCLKGEWALCGNLLNLTKRTTATEQWKKKVPASLQARLHYYHSLTLAHQAKYEDARLEVLMAQRLAPHAKLSVGFEQHLQRLSLVVDLLLMDIPSRSVFRLPKMERMLKDGGYLCLTRAVRVGDFACYEQLLEDKDSCFRRDSLHVLVGLLERNVLCSGLKRIIKAYGRIGIIDITRKLGLPSTDRTLEMVKASINDNTLPGCHLESKESSLADNVVLVVGEEVLQYRTSQPTKAFIERIQTLTELSRHCRMSMQYPEEGGDFNAKKGGKGSSAKGKDGAEEEDDDEEEESAAAGADEDYEIMEDEVDDYMED